MSRKLKTAWFRKQRHKLSVEIVAGRLFEKLRGDKAAYSKSWTEIADGNETNETKFVLS